MSRRFFYISLGILCLAVAYGQMDSKALADRTESTPTEVAVLTGVLNDGEIIPFPVYADGTVAAETECHWTVSPSSQTLSIWVTPSDFYFVCRTEGRMIRCYVQRYGPVQIPGEANYMIVATRPVQGPTPTEKHSWGGVKQRFRD